MAVAGLCAVLAASLHTTHTPGFYTPDTIDTPDLIDTLGEYKSRHYTHLAGFYTPDTPDTHDTHDTLDILGECMSIVCYTHWQHTWLLHT